jgi:hypothetical protein
MEILKSDEESMKNSLSVDGYERLHDEAMDKASISIHFSDCDDIFENSRANSVIFNDVKKIKISLSQEQMRLNSEKDKNFLSVPKASSFHKLRSPTTFSICENKIEDFNSSQILSEKSDDSVSYQKIFHHNTNIPNHSIQHDEFYYAIPNKPSTSKSNEIQSLSNIVTKEIHSFEFPSNSMNLPSSFYCKICNNILTDPRILDCLHTFCVLCLSKLDASSNLENNQFWRKISDTSSEYTFQKIIKFYLNFYYSLFRSRSINFNITFKY